MTRLLGGDERALATLYDRHSSLVFSLARAVVGGDADAEEVTEDVFIQIWTSSQRFDPARGGLRGWLATIARSRALDHVRSRGRRASAHERSAAVHEDGISVELSGFEPPDARVLRAEVRASLDAALSDLNQDQRQAIELAYFNGLSQSEIASQLGEPLGTVKTRIRDGMGKLKERFGASRGPWS